MSHRQIQNPSFESADNLRSVSKALQKVTIHLGNYSESLDWMIKIPSFTLTRHMTSIGNI